MTDYNKVRNLLNITKPQGFTEEELEVCNPKGIVLPQALIDYYLELGKYPLSKGFRWTHLLLPRQLGSKKYTWKHSKFLVFYISSSPSWSYWYGIRCDQLSESNPPVYICNTFKDLEDSEDYEDDEDNNGWKYYCNTVQSFLIAQAYDASYFLHKYTSRTLYQVTNYDLLFILKHYKSKGIILTTYRSENNEQLDTLDNYVLSYFADISYNRIVELFGNKNYDDSKFSDIYQQGVMTAFNNNYFDSDESILDHSTLYFGNHDDSVITVENMSIQYSSLTKEHFDEMDRDFSKLRKMVLIDGDDDLK